MTLAYEAMHQHSVHTRAQGRTATSAQLVDHLLALGLGGQKGRPYGYGRAIHTGMKAAHVWVEAAYGKPEADAFSYTYTDINGKYIF